MRNLNEAARAFAAALLLAGCDGGRDDTGPPEESVATVDGAATPDSGAAPVGRGCALIEEAALEQAIGFDVVMNDNTTGNCVATPATGAPNDPTVDFRIEPRTAAFDYFSAQSDATPIEGLAERAVWATLNETTGYVVAVRAGRSIVVGIGDADGVDDASRERAEAVARLLIGPAADD